MSFEECPSCGTGQLKYEQYQGCLCVIIFDVECATEERIIKLLDSHRLPNCNGDTDESGYCLTCNINLHDAIAIIKGENK